MMMDFVVKIMTAVCIVVVVVTLEVMAFSIAKTIVETSDDYLKRKLKERRGEQDKEKEDDCGNKKNIE